MPRKSPEPPLENDNTNTFGKFLYQRRNAVGLTQLELAKALSQAGYSFSDSSVSHWENPNPAKAHMPPLEDRGFVRTLARLLQTGPFWLYEAAGWIDGADIPISWEYIEIIKALEKMSPEQRSFIRKIILLPDS